MKFRKMLYLIATASFAAGCCGTSYGQGKVTLLLIPDQAAQKNEITINDLGAGAENTVAFNATRHAYPVDIALRSASEDFDVSGVDVVVGDAVALHFHVVASQVGSPMNVRLPLVKVDAYSAAAIQALEGEFAEDNEFDNMRVYLASRKIAHYYLLESPRHTGAVRSTVLWYKAAYRLAALKGRPYRMDKDARDQMDKMRNLASRDPAFKKILDSIIPTAHLNGIVSQLAALEFRDAGEIPDLLRSHNADAALALNDSLLKSFEALEPDAQKQVTANQGVTAGLLRSNARYIQTIVNSQTAM